MGYARRTGLIDSPGHPEACKVIEPVRKLMAFGLSVEEIEYLHIRQPMLQAVCEYARLDDRGENPEGRAADAVEATLKVIGDQIHNLDLEIQMLSLRRRALMRRTRVLEKLARSLGNRDSSLLAA